MNPAEKAQNRAESVIEKRLRKVYGNARDEMRKQLTAFEKRTKSLEASMVAKRDRGEITDDELKKWRQYRVFRGENWRSQIDAMTQTLEQSNRVVLQIVNGKTSDVFAAGRNYEAYEIESDIGARIGTSFELYDEATVARLLRKQPELLPRRKKLNGQKDRAWNTKNISDTVTSGILQGKSLQEVTQDLAKSLSSTNMKAMSRYAQTAMTGAQNAGRIDAMHTAESMGIKIRKKWLATLDRHTRVSHQKMDGKVVDIDEEFPNGLQYPGDPDGDPAEVYNCRCTLINVYPEYPAANGKRRDGEGNVLGEMTYKEWEKAKKGIAPFRMGDERAIFDRASVIKDITSKLGQNAFGGDVAEEYRKAITDSLQNADEKMLQIVQRTADKVHVDWVGENPSHNVSHYTPGSGHITIITKDAIGEPRTPEDIIETFWHEYGHFVDDAAVSGSGYSYKGEYGDYFFHSIQAEIMKDDKWMYATTEDVNRLLKFAGIDDRYECKFESGMYSAGIYRNGEWLNPRSMDFDYHKELEDALTKWVNQFSGEISLDDYRKQFGYPDRPERGNFIETYFTPKRNLYRERELFKGARDAYDRAIREYYEKVDAYEKTHDMEKIYKEWEKLADKAKKRKEAVASATDTLDGGVGGAFFAFILHGGHTPDYYAINRMGANEGIANVYSALMTKNKNVNEAMQELCPSLFKLIKGVILK